MAMKFLLLAGTLLGAAPALAQQSAPGSPTDRSQQSAETAPDDSRDGEIVVTGTRLGERTVTTSPVPIDLLRGDDLRASGYQETTEVLRQLAPSFAFATPTTPDGNTHIHSASLRGLSPDETLVLVNGKRLHTAAWVNTGGTIGKGAVPTDLNQIPAAGIGRIEILRDGASSQYGSDAIAGVINILLREDTALHATASAGSTYDGGGDTYEFSLGGGLKLGDDGFVNVTGYYRDHEAANRARPDTRQFYLGTSPTGTPQPLSARYGAGIGLNPPGGVAGTRLDPREASVDRNVWRFADEGDLKDASVIVNLEKPLGAVELYGFGGYRVSKAHSNASFRRPGQDENVRAIYPDGFLPFVNTRSTDYSAALGLRGEVAGWKWDLSTVYGGNSIEYRTENTLNATLGTASPTRFYNGKYENSQWTSDLTLSRAFEVGLAAPLSFAVGAEYRRDDYKIGAGEPASYAYGPERVLDGPNAGAVPTIGSQGFAGIQPGDVVDVHRHAIGLFAELGTELVRGWEIDLSGRYEDYSDFGDTWNGQASTRIVLPAGFALRGSVGTGFHAPALAQQYFSSTSSRTIVNNSTGFPEFVLVRTAPVGSALAQALGAEPLRPEKSTNWGGGLTYAGGELTASVDYYHIDIDDRIVLSSNYVDAPGSRRLRDYLASIGIPGVTSVRYFTNAVDTRTQGVDVTVAYRARLGDSADLRLSAAYNHNETRIRRIAATPLEITALGITTPLFDINERTRVQYGQPQNKVALGANLRLGAITFDVRATRYGEVEQVALTNQSVANLALIAAGSTPYRTVPTESGAAGNVDVIQRLKAKWVTDFSFTGQVNPHLAVTVGANNLFNVYPTENIRSTPALTGADTFGAFPYSEFSPFGFSGAFYYVRAGVRF
ncbi:TonB-dependent receptor [Sphingomonas cannabina]|uniref:TonB-dependent receptor plug domain-containing protein n=1 Tax=Sphingomonas cannabina TaxID=2899123 RepID=UPI001F407A3B|nr:TonB-dependent receptor [Sphingomonas cannabina]UIJ46623.1 TonB-dependent receptor [Sphingomonas cannabina]